MPELLLRGKPIGKCKGILFDKDGTLASSEKRLLELGELRIKEAVRLYEQTRSKDFESDIKKYLTSAYGINDQVIDPNGSMAIASRSNNLISTATVFCLIGESWPNSLQLANQIFKSADMLLQNQNNPSASSELLPGVLNLLEILKESGTHLGLISNDSMKGINQFLKAHNLQSQFKQIWSADHYPSKPSPDAIKGLCDAMNLNTSECVLIGDAETDLVMGQESNIKLVLGYTAGWSKKPLLYEYDHLIDHWDELDVH